MLAILGAASFSPLARAPAQTAGATLLVEARDRGGAPVPGVVVTLTSDETGLERAGTPSTTGRSGSCGCRRGSTR